MAQGLRTGIASPFAKARIASGTMRSSAQSPPPITLPARAVAIARWGVWWAASPQKLLRQLWIAISAAALLAL